MRITEDIINELQTDDGHLGEIKFSSEINKLPRREGTIDILKKLGISNVIHVGCCGHLSNIEKQIKNNMHFHMMLTENFDNVIGFDISEDAIEYLSSFNVSGIYANDFVEEVDRVKAIIDETFDGSPYTILLPEVIEHISDPVSFLKKIVLQYGKQQNRIVISVPNAYGFGRICNVAIKNRESINMDHKYMFTPTTILKVMCMAGIMPEEIQFLDLYKYSRIFKKPVLSNTIVVSGRFKI